jgi:uncharacterized protein YneF (UPF0154 family)
MAPGDRLQKRTLIIGIVLIPLTALAIYFIYGSYLFQKWPWMRFSVVMATLTCLWTYTFWFGRVTGGNGDTLHPFFFGGAVIPFDVILMYPGTKTLGISSDSDMIFLLIVLEIIHGFGFFFIQREIQEYLQSLSGGQT